MQIARLKPDALRVSYGGPLDREGAPDVAPQAFHAQAAEATQLQTIQPPLD